MFQPGLGAQALDTPLSFRSPVSREVAQSRGGLGIHSHLVPQEAATASFEGTEGPSCQFNSFDYNGKLLFTHMIIIVLCLCAFEFTKHFHIY